MRIIISFFILLSVGFCFGYNDPQTTGDKKLTMYKIQPKDTWTNLSKKFNVTIKELQVINVGVTDLKIGQIIQAPSMFPSKENGIAQKEKSSVSISTNNHLGKTPIYYSVKKGETLYRISVNNKVSVDDLKKWNGLSSNTVSVDQRLIVGYGAQTIKVVETNEAAPKDTQATQIPKPKEVTETLLPPVKKETKPDSAIKEIATSTGVSKVVETGIAAWFMDDDLNQNKFYALHRTAAIGTIIKVTNRMNNNSVFVKVVGALPTTSDNENVLIKITQAAAQRIGALDQRFQAEITYGITQ